MLDSVDFIAHLTGVGETGERFQSGGHYGFEVGAVVDCQSKPRKRHECVSGQDNSPGEARDEIHRFATADIELLGGVLEAVEE